MKKNIVTYFIWGLLMTSAQFCISQSSQECEIADAIFQAVRSGQLMAYTKDNVKIRNAEHLFVFEEKVISGDEIVTIQYNRNADDVSQVKTSPYKKSVELIFYINNYSDEGVTVGESFWFKVRMR
ncbi:MAG: hypothetical protein ACPGED_01020 [Flavobacteriales bacterium]